MMERMISRSAKPPRRRPASPPPRGFTLIACLAVLVLLLVVAMGLLSLSTVVIRNAGAGHYQAEARANARLALMVAIGELQTQLGPDQRISATADLLAGDEPTQNRHWTGVWSSQLADGGPVWVRDDSDGGLKDRRVEQEYDPEAAVLSYLVSGNEGGRAIRGERMMSPDKLILGTRSVRLVGPGSTAAEPDGGHVHAPRVGVEAGPNRSGHYAYWVGDLGVRANLATRNRHAGEASEESAYLTATSQSANPEVFSSDRGPFPEIDEESRSKLLSDRQLDLFLRDGGEGRSTLFHDITFSSAGVLANVRDGGLKLDLTAYFASNGNIPAPEGRPELGLSDEDRLVGPRNEALAAARGVEWSATRHQNTAPRFGLLRTWARLGEKIHRPDGISEAQLPKLEPDPRIPDLARSGNVNLNPVTIAELDTANLVPTVVEAAYYFSLSCYETTQWPGRWQLREHYFPRVVLWNPFNASIKLPRTAVMMQGRGRREWWVMRQGKSIPRLYTFYHPGKKTLAENTVEEFYDNFDSATVGNLYFSIPETEFGPGECLVFSCKQAGEYTRDNILDNELSCSVSPDPARNFYVTDAQVGSPEYLSKRPFVEFWEQPFSSRLKNQGDDMQMVFKSVGSNSSVSTVDFDGLPQLSLVSCSLQYGAGKEPRLKWNSLNPTPIETSDEAYGLSPLTISPDVRTRDGFRLRWFEEHASNEIGSGPLYDPGSGTPHFHTAPIATWNMRASYAMRTPWDNVAGTMPTSGAAGGFGGGPWFFGVYTRDLFDGAVGFAEQAPVYREGRYRGNPFGQPQDYSLFQENYVLFDVPRKAGEVFSLGNLQHAKVSEFSWHPSYVIGQSLVDPRVGTTRTLPERDKKSHGWTADAIGWSKDGERSSDPDEWARFGRALLQNYPVEDEVVYDISFEANHALWDEFFLSTGDDSRKSSLLRSRGADPLPNGRMILAEATRNEASAAALSDYGAAAYHLMVDGAFNVNSTSVPAWMALLASTRGYHQAGEGRTPFPRVMDSPGSSWDGLNPFDSNAWSGFRVLSDDEIERLAGEIVRQVELRGPFLSLSDFVNRRLAADETGRMGPLQAAIEAAGLNETFETSAPLELNNEDPLADYSHPDNIDDATRLDQTLKPDTKAWGAPGFLTQGDILQILGPVLSARSDSFVVRAYGDAVDARGEIKARAWCEAVVQRTPVPVRPDADGRDPLQDGKGRDFGRRFAVKSFRWLSPEEV